MRSVLYCVFSLLLLGIFSCSDLERENPLDPKNPSSRTESTILIEAFVNTSPELPEALRFSDFALRAFDNMEELYGSRVIIAEYHRSSEQLGYKDPFDPDGRYEPLYEKYVDNSVGDLKGVPDVFINGVLHRVQGAYDTASMQIRLNNLLSQIVLDDGFYSLEPVAYAENNTVYLSCRLARLGNQSAEDLRLRVIFLKKFDNQLLKRVVVADDAVGKYSVSIDRLNAGEYKTVSFDTITFGELPDALVFILSNNDETLIFSSAKAEL